MNTGNLTVKNSFVRQNIKISQQKSQKKLIYTRKYLQKFLIIIDSNSLLLIFFGYVLIASLEHTQYSPNSQVCLLFLVLTIQDEIAFIFY